MLETSNQFEHTLTTALAFAFHVKKKTGGRKQKFSHVCNFFIGKFNEGYGEMYGQSDRTAN